MFPRWWRSRRAERVAAAATEEGREDPRVPGTFLSHHPSWRNSLSQNYLKEIFLGETVEYSEMLICLDNTFPDSSNSTNIATTRLVSKWAPQAVESLSAEAEIWLQGESTNDVQAEQEHPRRLRRDRVASAVGRKQAP